MKAEQMEDPKTYRETWEEKQATKQAARDEQEQLRIVERRRALQDYPFDPRTEVSADAKRITRTLWIIFVVLPVIFAILYSIGHQ